MPKIYSNEEFWTIENFQQDNKFYTVELLKKLLPKEGFRSKLKYAEIMKKHEGFYPESSKFYFSLFKSIYESENNKQKKEIKDFLKEGLKNGLGTTTSTRFESRFEILHNEGLSNQEQYYRKKQELHRGPIKNLGSSEFCGALLGCRDAQEVNKIINWFTGNEVIMNWARDFKYWTCTFDSYDPSKEFFLNAGNYLTTKKNSLGVRVRK